MQLTYHIDRQQRYILELLAGQVTTENTMHIFQQIWEDPAYDPEFNIFMDIREADVQMTEAELMQMIQFFDQQSMSSRAKVVILIEAPIETTLAFMYQKEVQPQTVKLFNDLEDALTYAGLDLETYDVLNSDLATTLTA